MAAITQSVLRKDHEAKVTGQTKYLEDQPRDGVLTGMLLRSPVAYGKLLGYDVPELPDGYAVVDARDVPGENNIPIFLNDTPVFARDTVEYVGDPIALVVGPDPAVVSRLVRAIKPRIEPLPPVLDPLLSDTHFFQYAYDRGDLAAAFQTADFVVDETFHTGHQEHVHLETNAMQADFQNGRLSVRGSMQCPYYILKALKPVMGLDAAQIRILQTPTGGGFGGKEDQPSILACQVAVASKKLEKPVRLVYTRQEDMAYSPKRHPSICHYRAAVKDGLVTAMDIDVTYDAGAYSTLSAVVLQRGLICSQGVYRVETLRVRGRASKTNSVPNGAFRGFGAPQVFYSVEMLMAHIAKRLGEDPVAFKMRNAVRQNDPTATDGRFHFHVPIPEMTARVLAMSDYSAKRKAYDAPQTGRYRRGIGLAYALHGCGFTGNGERDIIRSVVRLRGNADGSCELLIGSTEIGQGLTTVLCKLVAEAMAIPLNQVSMPAPDTDYTSDSGPTVASRSAMIVGYLVQKACAQLKPVWHPGEKRVVEAHYEHPPFLIPFDLATFQGDAYPDYAWLANVVEVMVDTLTGEISVLNAYGVYDTGVALDRNILAGQMAGGLVQSIGYASTEKMAYDARGVIRNDRLADYILPTAADIGHIEVDFVENPYPYGPHGAKGAGELPNVGGAPAYLLAVEQALGRSFTSIPFGFEEALDALGKEATV